MSQIDGLRGLAALYVVVYHAYENCQLTFGGRGVPGWLHHGLGVLTFGQAAVAVFIVLSGYCLMMPIAQAGATGLRDGVRGYLKRRVRRIFPPYYGALALSLAAAAAVRAMGVNEGADGALSPVAFRADVLASHLLLIHNLNIEWAFRIDYPLWSVATEWQIYFLFPLALLPVWRRWGMGAAVGAGFAIGMLPHWLFGGRVDLARFEYVGLFALGMAGAALSFSREARDVARRENVRWGAICLALLGPLALFAKYRAHWDWAQMVTINCLAGVATTCLLLYCVQALLRGGHGRAPWVVRFLQARPCVALGSFSYSLYVIHAPILALAMLVIGRFHLSPLGDLGVALVVAVPAATGAAWLFFLVFERPFLVRRRGESAGEVARDAALSPAP